MGKTTSSRVAITTFAAAVIVAAGFGFYRMNAARNAQEQVEKTGMEYQQLGAMPQSDYVRVHHLQDQVVASRKLGDADVDWLLLLLRDDKNSVGRARVLGVLSTLKDPPAEQRSKIGTIVKPMLSDKDEVVRRYSARVQRNLGI
jgi:hypothetical protein